MTLLRSALSVLALLRSALSVLALLVALPAQGAVIRGVKIKTKDNNTSYRIEVKANEDANNKVKAVNFAAISDSDAGGETVGLVESGAWMHGAAAIKALPKTDAALTLVLYEGTGAKLASFSGGVLGRQPVHKPG